MRLLLLAGLRVTLLAILIPCAAYIPTSKFNSYKIWIPKKLEPRDGRQIEGYISYTINIEGKEHMVHLTPNRKVLSKDFTLFTYNSKGELIMEQPYIGDDCYYQGTVEGFENSLVVVNTCSGLRGWLETSALTYGIQSIEVPSTFQTEDLDSEGLVCEENYLNSSERMEEDDDFNPSNESLEIIREKRRYVEVYVVVDYERFETNKKQINVTQAQVGDLINLADKMYDVLNIDIILVGLEIWTEKNLINIEDTNATAVLNRFREWKIEHLDPRLKCDIAVLILRRGYGTVAGNAYFSTLCSKNYSVVFASYRKNLPLTAIIFVHELGHSIGMLHETYKCSCRSPPCILDAKPDNRAKFFSTCSYEQYAKFIKKGKAECLLNNPVPDQTETPQTAGSCGDKVVNENEECDCGSIEECNKDPCCDIKCKLKQRAECGIGMCCKECKIMNKGIPCRIPVSECDLAEYCNGKSAICPPDVFSQDGTPCNKGQSVCYRNICYDYNRHCRQMFGKGAKGAPLECFTAVNTTGDRYGNCSNAENKTKCESNIVKCGLAQCVNVKNISLSDNRTSIVQTPMGKSWCWSLDYKLNMDIPHVGRVPDGAKCDIGKICLSGKCVPDSALKYDCDAKNKCSGRGVCNNKKNCHCNKGWTPPNCMIKGFGGSFNSGPLVKGSFVNYVYPAEDDDGLSTSMKYIISLAVLLGVGILILAIVAYVKIWKPESLWTILRSRISSATTNTSETTEESEASEESKE